MTGIAFDTLAFANKLKGAGMESRLADTQAEETAKIFNYLATNLLATKNDLNNLKTELLKEIHANTWRIIGLLGGLQAIFHFIN
jgi:hypothetical protein